MAIVSSYNDYLKLYEQMEPALRRIFAEAEKPFPDDPWELLNMVISRQLAEGNEGIIEASLKNSDFIKASKVMERLIKEELNTPHEYELPRHVIERIYDFALHKRATDQCADVLTMLELLKMENAIPRFKSSFEINYSAVAKNIRNELELPSSRKKTLTRWTHKYVADFW
jgi:hypothetical protein